MPIRVEGGNRGHMISLAPIQHGMPTRATWPFGATIAARPSTGTESIQKAEVAAMVLFPKFACEEEAFMGCANHPVEPEIRFLDGRTERFVKLPPTRWQRLTEWDALRGATDRLKPSRG